jgi:alkylated DNA repair dioxygenase AlkB
MALPPGFRYVPEFIDAGEEARLLEALATVEFSDVAMRGQIARRRTAHFGWVYGYESWRIEPGPPLPSAFHPLRGKAAALIDVAEEALAEVLITTYPAGAGIGWHRDAPQFGVVIGISLLSPCRFRFQRGSGDARETTAIELAPRSAYVLDGEARSGWQHAIPPTKAPRYSITFRTLRREADQRGVLSRR